MITSIYFEDDQVLIQSAIDLVKDVAFVCWRVKPSIEIKEISLHGSLTEVAIDYFNDSVSSDVSATQSHEAVEIVSAFIHGYIAGANRNGAA
jgi:predicted DNA-binding protein with PD1-like motif